MKWLQRDGTVCVLLVGVLLMTCGCDKVIQKANRAAYFGAGGYADTTLQFSQFFDNNHTLTCWFMEQYSLGYPGLMLAETGSGTFHIGQGSYKALAGSESPGTKLLLKVGSVRQTYGLNLQTTSRRWRHLAVVRSGNTFTVFVDGFALSPAVTVNANDVALPDGNNTLRLGQATVGALIDGGRKGHYYGFLDDVGVFDRALTSEEIDDLVAAKRLTGGEEGLIAAWNFDLVQPNGQPLPAVFTQYPLTFQTSTPGLTPAGRMIVSPDRNNLLDRKFLPLPFQLAKTRLPFAPGQSWYVLQGWEKTLSHNGPAVFAYDFRRPNVPEPDSCGVSVFASAGGTVADYSDAGHPTDIDNPNFVQLTHNAYEAMVYSHLKTGTVGPALNFQTPPFTVDAQDKVGEVGTAGANNCHLHTSLRTDNTDQGTTIPMAYSDYQASDDNGGLWYDVPIGVPQHGQWVRNPPLILEVTEPEIIIAVIEQRAFGSLDVALQRADSRVTAVEVRRVSLSVSNLLLHLSLENLLPFLPRLNGVLTSSDLSLGSTAAMTMAVDPGGNLDLTGLPLRAVGNWILDLRRLGRYSEAIDEPLEPPLLRISGHLVEGRQTVLHLMADLGVGTLEAAFAGDLSPDGTGTLALTGQAVTLRSPYLVAGQADINRDGRLDERDFNLFVQAFTGSNAWHLSTAGWLRNESRASARVEIDPALPAPHPGDRPWDIGVLIDGVPTRGNWGNGPGNYDTFNGTSAVEDNEWLALLVGAPRRPPELIDTPGETHAPEQPLPFNAFRYWRGPQYSDGGWWAGPVTVEVMTSGDPFSDADVLADHHWVPVAQSDRALGTMTAGPFATTPEPNDDPYWDSRTKVHLEPNDPPSGSYQFSNEGDADDERPHRAHHANDLDGERYVARPDYLHFEFPETYGFGIRIRGPSASGPRGEGTYVSGAELEAWYNPANVPGHACPIIAHPAWREAFDLDEDEDVDMTDYESFLRDYTGKPHLERVDVNGDRLQLQFNALANRSYEIQSRRLLEVEAEDWDTYATFGPEPVPRRVTVESLLAGSQRFFRLALRP